MIVLFTDFGLHGPYTGQVNAVLHQMAPGVPAIDSSPMRPWAIPKRRLTFWRSLPHGFLAGIEWPILPSI
jgi:S-adenosyl-L-methionine hydrolase (adenosine-forming)